MHGGCSHFGSNLRREKLNVPEAARRAVCDVLCGMAKRVKTSCLCERSKQYLCERSARQPQGRRALNSNENSREINWAPSHFTPLFYMHIDRSVFVLWLRHKYYIKICISTAHVTRHLLGGTAVDHVMSGRLLEADTRRHVHCSFLAVGNMWKITDMNPIPRHIAETI